MKKLVVTMLIATMTVSMAACGGNNNNVSTESAATETSVESAVEETETTETETEETNSTEESTADATEGTTGEILLADFQKLMEENANLSAEELAEAVISNAIIEFAPGTMPVEEGLLTGFGNAEITGFEEGAMFAPMISTIPFVGYIFELDADADVEAFKAALSENANLRWNVCTEAEELVVESVDNTVFFLMCPKSLNE